MNIPPILLLVVGASFALGYASLITIGWAITRHNRKLFQRVSGIECLPFYNLEKGRIVNENVKVKSISLNKNYFRFSTV